MMQMPMSLERLDQLKKAETAIYSHLEEMFRNGSYTNQQRDFIRGVLDLGHWQISAGCSWFEYDLLRAPHEVAQLEDVIQNWDQKPPAERPSLNRETVEKKLFDLQKGIRQKEAEVEKAKREGCFWSIVPLLEFFDLPEEERAGMSCYPLLPFFMQKAYEEMQTPRQPKPGLMARLLGSIKRIKVAISVKGGEVEIERYDPGKSDKEK